MTARRRVAMGVAAQGRRGPDSNCYRAARGRSAATPSAARRHSASLGWTFILLDVLGAILTIGNEVVSGDVANTNAAWLGRRLEELGVRIVLSAAVPDEIEAIADIVNFE